MINSNQAKIICYKNKKTIILNKKKKKKKKNKKKKKKKKKKSKRWDNIKVAFHEIQYTVILMRYIII